MEVWGAFSTRKVFHIIAVGGGGAAAAAGIVVVVVVIGGVVEFAHFWMYTYYHVMCTKYVSYRD
jgi:hypothetical protein